MFPWSPVELGEEGEILVLVQAQVVREVAQIES